MAKFETYLMTNFDINPDGEQFEMDVFVSSRRIERGDIIDVHSLNSTEYYRFWRVIEIVHRQDKVIALVKYLEDERTALHPQYLL